MLNTLKLRLVCLSGFRAERPSVDSCSGEAKFLTTAVKHRFITLITLIRANPMGYLIVLLSNEILFQAYQTLQSTPAVIS